MNASGPGIAWIAVPVIGLFLLTLLFGLLALLSFKATRPLGVVVVLVLLLIVGMVGFYGLVSVRVTPSQMSASTYTYEDSATMAPQQAPAEFRIEAHYTSRDQLPKVESSAPQPVTIDSPAIARAAEAPPVEVGEPAANSDSPSEPAVNPTTDAAPAEKPAEPAPPAEAVPALPPADVVPALPPPANTTPATTIVAEKLPAAPAVRPAWVDAPRHREQQVYQVAVKSGLFVTTIECERALEKAMQRSVDAYIDEYLEDGAAQLVAIEPHFIQQHIRRGAFSDTSESSVGTMQQVYALLVFDDGVQSLFQQRWRQALVNQRLWQVGAGSAVVLGLIGTLFGFLSWGQRSATAPAIPRVVTEKSGAAVATYGRFWLHCAVVVAILIGVLAFLV